MKINELVSTVENFFKDVLRRPGAVVGIQKDQDMWKVQIEVAEEVEYMRKRAKDDLIAMYEVAVDRHMEILSFERKYLRERVSTDIGNA